MMRIVSWNIRAGGGQRVALIASQLQRWSPDVVALQEFRATAPSLQLAEALARQGLVHQRSTADREQPSANRLLLASRWPLRIVTLARAPSEPGRWLMAHVAAPEALSIATMHVPNMVTGRKYTFLNAVLEVARSWRGSPALMAGDTNSGWIGLDEEAAAFTPREDGWMDAMGGAGWPDAFRRLHADERAYTWYSPNGRNGFRLDEAFVDRRLLPRVRDVRYVWGRGGRDRRRPALSDHAAVVMDFDALS